MLEWYPQVVVDLHEMGGNSTYYFAPPADPFNPLITEVAAEDRSTCSAAPTPRSSTGAASPYFVREVYDAFYPGYGDSWPTFHGAVAMTYEQASARGLAYRRDDGTILTYQGRRSRSTSPPRSRPPSPPRRTASSCCASYLDYRRGAIELGQKGTREYLIPPGKGPGARDAARAAPGRPGHRGEAGGGGVHGGGPADAGRHLHRPAGAARRTAGAQPARSRHQDGRGVPEGAGPPAQGAAERPDLRRDRVEPAAHVRRGGRRERPRDRACARATSAATRPKRRRRRSRPRCRPAPSVS